MVIALQATPIAVSDPVSGIAVEVDLATAPAEGVGVTGATVATGTLVDGANAVALPALPSSALVPTDRQTATASIETATTSRAVTTTDLASTLTLPPPIDAHFDDGQAAVAWTDGPEASFAEYAYDGAGVLLADADAGWLAAHAHALAFDSSFPGFDAAWLGDIFDISLFVSSEEAGAQAFASVSEAR